MARRCGCAQDSCSCLISPIGAGITVTGTGSPKNPYVVNSTVATIETGIDVQVNNTNVALDVHRLDFRGTGVTVVPGTDEAVVTIAGATGGTGVTAPPGTVWMFAAATPPAGWLLCDGATVLVATYPALFGAIGILYGGNGTTDFKLPNLMDRFPVGASATKAIGATGGAATKGIAVANLPNHTHSIAHNHGPRNTTSAGVHNHNLEMSDNDGGGSTVRRGTSTSAPGVGAIEASPSHYHSVDLGNYVGNTSATNGASATPLDITPPYQALAFIIRF